MEADHSRAVELPESAWQQARELGRRVEEATRDLPFGGEPAGLLETLERLATEADQSESRP